MKNGKKEFKDLRAEGATPGERERKKRTMKLLPFLMFGLIAVFIARQESPEFAAWVDRLLDAEAWAATEACHKASLEETGLPGFARLLDRGDAQETLDGYFVDSVDYAVMESDGKEREYSFSCNVSRDGKVVSIKAGQFMPPEVVREQIK